MDHCEFAFPHLEPVLHSYLYDEQRQTFVSHTRSAIYVWARQGTELYPESEAPHTRLVVPAPEATEFTDMVVIHPALVLADAAGYLNVYLPEQNTFALSTRVESMKGCRIIDMDFKRDLFVLHEKGFVSRFKNFGALENGVQNFQQFAEAQNVPLKVSKNAVRLSVYAQEHLPQLVFVTEKYAVQVFCTPAGSSWQILQEVGYLSEQLKKKDVSGIDATAFCAADQTVLVGNKNGNVQVWEIRMEEDREDPLGFRLQFVPVVTQW